MRLKYYTLFSHFSATRGARNARAAPSLPGSTPPGASGPARAAISCGSGANACTAAGPAAARGRVNAQHAAVQGVAAPSTCTSPPRTASRPKRAARMGKVHPYLVRAARAKRAGRQKSTPARRQHAIARAGRLALRTRTGQNGIAPGNRAAELARFGGRRAAQSIIYLLRAFCQKRRGIGVHGAQHKAAGAFIQPVNGRNTCPFAPRVRKARKRRFRQRAAHASPRVGVQAAMPPFPAPWRARPHTRCDADIRQERWCPPPASSKELQPRPPLSRAGLHRVGTPSQNKSPAVLHTLAEAQAERRFGAARLRRKAHVLTRRHIEMSGACRACQPQIQAGWAGLRVNSPSRDLQP